MPGHPQHSMAPGAFPSTTYLSEDPNADPTHLLMATQIENAPQQDPDRAYDHATSHAIRRVLRGCGQQRLDWFLIFDLQLWKEVRSGLRELYMATLMLDGRYKMKIALTFSRNYPRLSRAFLTQDRAPEHSVLLFSVQLFTAPTLSAELVDHHRFLYIILSVLKRFFVEPTPEFLRHQGVVLCDTESFRNRRYFHVFHDMRYLAGTPQVRNWVSSQHQFLATYVGFIGLFQGMNPNRRAVLQHVEFEADTWVNAFNVTLQVAKSCRQFAECYGISARDLFFAMRGTLRALRHSVALMAEENCAVIIRTAQMQGLLGPEAGHTVNTGGNLGDAMPLVAEAHIRSTMWGSQYYIVKYDVASCPVSFHHPLHWFMAELCQHVKLLSEDIAREYGFDSIRHMIFTAFNVSYDSALEGPTDAAMDDSGAGSSGSSGAASRAARSHRRIMTQTDIERAQHELLRILDYPIRVCVVMAQIRAGLWVRNGYVIRSQSHHYREVSLRENTYDQDIVMIQFFLSIWPDTDHILMALLDRFGLYDWFSGQPHVSEVYEQSHLQYMVEEFLNVLIVLVSERHVATGKNALDLARREIVHGCLSPIAYSELSKKIPERLAEHTEFDNLLQEMAEYRSPVSIMDFGMYELKDEYLDEVDPYFIHYSRNQREEVEELLHERLKKRLRRSGGDPDAVPAYIPPKLDPIRFGPFQRLGMVLHTPLACQVLFNALYHATNTPNHYMSETMVDEALQLVVLALEDGRRGAVAREIGGPDVNPDGEEGNTPNRGGLWKYALEQGYPMSKGGKPMNFLALVLSLGLRSELKQWKPKLDYILKLFREGGPRVISCIDEYYASLESTPLGSHVLRTAQDEASAAERKKQEAKARQAAILADFANRQQNFMAQFGDEFDDLTDEEDFDKADDVAETSADKGKGSDMSRVHNSLWTTPGGTCIVCQEECDGTKPYGILSLVQASRVARTAPLSDVISVTDILGMPGGLDCEINDAPVIAPQTPESSMSASKISAQMRLADQAGLNGQVAAGAYGAPSGLKGFPVLYHERGMVANTCGHLMHLRCFTQYYQGIEAKRQNQPTRNHPENPHRKEYLCPLCKSLGNILLPVLPHVGDYDPLTITDQNPERFAVPASQRTDQATAEFERWLQDDWRELGETIVAVTNGRTSSKVAPVLSGGPGSQAESSSGSDREGTSQARTPSSSTPAIGAAAVAAPGGSTPEAPAGFRAMGQTPEDTLASGLIASLRNAGGFSFNLPEGLTESLPRNLDLLRAAQRLPGGFAAVQTLLQRFLQPSTNAAFSLVPGSERMVLPLSQYVRWMFDMHFADTHHHHHQRRQAHSGTGSHSGYSTPEASGYDQAFAAGGRHMFAQNTEAQSRAAAEKESRMRGQLEEYQFMYTRLYEVVQQVQRDNHVGLPSVSLFEHIGKGKGKGKSKGKSKSK
ncbi:E3 ubiquitin-protein ligase ubr1, partial [Linderina pennispora]